MHLGTVHGILRLPMSGRSRAVGGRGRERQALVTGGGPAAGLHSDFISGEQDSSEQGRDTYIFTVLAD